MYELISLTPSGDVFAVHTLNDGRVLACGPLHSTDWERPLDYFEYDEEWNAEGYADGMAGQDPDEPHVWLGDDYAVIRTEGENQP